MSSYQKNTLNQSGVVIDNLQVNKTANLPNTLTTDGDYIGVNAIGGTKNFKNNVGFTNGINAQGSSTINNLTISGTFTAPNGGYVDTTTTQTITGDKTFNNLSSNTLNITGSSPVITTQTGSISGSTLTLSSTNSSVVVGQQISIPNSLNPFILDNCIYINENPSKFSSVTTTIPIGSYITGYYNGTYIKSTITSVIQNLGSATYFISPSYSELTTSFYISFTITPPSVPSNTIIISGSGLIYTLNKTILPVITNAVINFYNQNPVITSVNSQITNLTVNNGLNVKSGTVSLPNSCITDAMLQTKPYTPPPTLTATNGLVVQTGTTQLGSNYSSTDAANTGLFVGDAKATVAASITPFLLTGSLVQINSFTSYTGSTVSAVGGLFMYGFNTTTNVFWFGYGTGTAQQSLMTFTIGS